MTDHRNESSGHSPSTSATAVAIAPLMHEPATAATIGAFASWLDTQLVELEDRYRHNTTHQSAKRSFGRK